jgi:peptidoglycan/xylan/chitin deacetylase (PgdA/CDA1 family)
MKLRRAAFDCCYYTGVARMLAVPAIGEVRYCVMTYHGVSDEPQALFTSTRLFEAHLRFYQCWGRTATMNELGGFLNGEPIPTGPRLRFVITFDDGYANVIQTAVPLLRKYGVKAIAYVNPSWIDGAVIPWWFDIAGIDPRAKALRRLLAGEGYGSYSSPEAAEAHVWPDELITDIVAKVPQEAFAAWWTTQAARVPQLAPGEVMKTRLATWAELASARDVLEIGSHTLSHSVLGLCCDPEYVRREIALSKTAIEDHMGIACAHFAYPRGQDTDHNAQTQQMLAAAGHKTAVTTRPAAAVQGENPLAIPRFYVSETPVAELAAQLAGVLDKWDRSVSRLRSSLGK